MRVEARRRAPVDGGFGRSSILRLALRDLDTFENSNNLSKVPRRTIRFSNAATLNLISQGHDINR